jgi:4-carboxymuconolactone decarboxylase
VSGALAAGEALLVDVSAALAARREGPLVAALKAALGGPVDPAAVEEVVLQAYLFLGYPAALNGFALWRELSGRAAAPPEGEDWDAWRERGERVCRRVYAGQFEALQENVRALHPDLATWMLVEGYGKVIGRSALDLRSRELCIVALLAVLDAPRQLRSHLRGALHVGATAGQVEEALGRALEHAEDGARGRAHETWRVVRSRWSTRTAATEE